MNVHHRLESFLQKVVNDTATITIHRNPARCYNGTPAGLWYLDTQRDFVRNVLNCRVTTGMPWKVTLTNHAVSASFPSSQNESNGCVLEQAPFNLRLQQDLLLGETVGLYSWKLPANSTSWCCELRSLPHIIILIPVPEGEST